MNRPLITNKVVSFLLILVSVFSLANFLYDYLKTPVKERGFLDFGFYHYYAKVHLALSPRKDLTSQEIFDHLTSAARCKTPHELEKIPYAHGPSIYPPIFYLLIVPFSHLNYSLATAFWIVINLSALVLTLYLIFSALNIKIKSVPFFLSLILILNYYPLMILLQAGQIDLITLSFVMLTFYFSQRNNDLAGSFFLTLAIICKIFPLVLLLYFLLKKRYKLIMGTLLFLGISFLLSLSLWGGKLHYVWLFQVIPWTINNAALYLPNLSFYSLACRLLSFRQMFNYLEIARIIQGGIFFLFLILAFRFRPRKDRDFLFYNFVVMLIYPASFLLELHHFVYLIPMFLVLICQLEEIKGKFIPILIILAYILIGMEYWPDGLRIFNQGLFQVFLYMKLYGFLCLYLAAYLFLRKKIKAERR